VRSPEYLFYCLEEVQVLKDLKDKLKLITDSTQRLRRHL